ncbi:MAG TPA: sigma-70 family RNA polymerase sigma factor [Xanthobacteraceae bacterium]|jgi:RNA polymerase sigma-70 factor (ECF subfamily)|nr:sigma-70 family RNA polymerase sigma factor [Xanthobacteraceae bacterium]
MQDGHARSQKIITALERQAAHEATPDEALLARIARRDAAAMRTLFARHHLGVYRFILRIVGNAAVAEDLTSDVFLAVWRQAERFEGRSTVSTWLLAIARYKAITAARRRETETLDGPALAIEDPSDGPELAIRKKDRSAILRTCLAQLSPKHREIVDLVYYHEKSIREVAEVIGVPENTVKTRMYYARQKLSELLEAAGLDRVSP